MARPTSSPAPAPVRAHMWRYSAASTCMSWRASSRTIRRRPRRGGRRQRRRPRRHHDRGGSRRRAARGGVQRRRGDQHGGVLPIRCCLLHERPPQLLRLRSVLPPISQNTALFSLLGTFYGGNGKSTFALPNLRDSSPWGRGRAPDSAITSSGNRAVRRSSRSSRAKYRHMPTRCAAISTPAT